MSLKPSFVYITLISSGARCARLTAAYTATANPNSNHCYYVSTLAMRADIPQCVIRAPVQGVLA